MVLKVPINESDFDKIQANMKTFLSRPGSTFENYGFSAGVMKGLIDFGSYVVHYMSYQLNKSIEEIFADTALLEDSIYSLMNNFNYIPKLKTPAKRYLKIEYDLTGITYNTGSTFKLFVNNIAYTNTLNMITTLRDKWQDEYYTNASSTAYVSQNLSYHYMNHYTDSGNYLKAIVPAYQAEWVNQEIAIGSSYDQYTWLQNSSSIKYGDKSVVDSLRVFVKEGGFTWYEYKNLKRGLFDDNKRAFNIVYDKDNGIKVEFGIDNFSRELADGETLRMYYPVTDGEDASEATGATSFVNTDVDDIQIVEITADGDIKIIYESNNNGINTSVANITTPLSDAQGTTAGFAVSGSLTAGQIYASSKLELSLQDENSVPAYMDNGSDRQSTESIKKSMTLFFSTQGRAVTETDYNAILRSKFTEFKDIRVWGGNREFIDNDVLIQGETETGLTEFDDSGTTKYKGTLTELKSVFNEILRKRYISNTLTVENVQYTDITSGKYTRDVGHIYYSFYDEGFRFVDSDANQEEITGYLDDFKILTLYFRYFNPNFTLIKPKITLKLKAAYYKSFDIGTMRGNIRDYVNDMSKFDAKFDIADLTAHLLTYDSVELVKNVSYSAKLKVRNSYDANDSTAARDNYIYIRTYTPITQDLNSTIATSHTLTSVGDVVYIDGSEAGTINKISGNIRIRNFNVTSEGSSSSTTDDLGSPFFTDSEFYIDDVSFSGNVIYSAKENVVGIENVTDIVLTLE